MAPAAWVTDLVHPERRTPATVVIGGLVTATLLYGRVERERRPQ